MIFAFSILSVIIHIGFCRCMNVVISVVLCNSVSVLNYLWLCSQIFQDGWTALMVASQEGRTDVVELLAEHNADVNAKKDVRLHTCDMHVRFI